MASGKGEEKMISLECADGEVFEVPLAACALSQTIRYAIEGCGHQEKIPLTQVDGATFRKIVSYLLEHQHDASAEKDRLAALREWDAKFIEVDVHCTLYLLLMASNFLGIKGLVNLCASKAADLIKGKTVEQIREIFKIQSDFSPEEEAAIRAENRWVFRCN